MHIVAESLQFQHKQRHIRQRANVHKSLDTIGEISFQNCGEQNALGYVNR